MMHDVASRPLQLTLPAGVESAWIDSFSGLRTDSDCEAGVQLPFIAGSVPSAYVSCHQDAAPGNPVEKTIDWIKGILR
jgi:penicillin-binding protein 1B